MNHRTTVRRRALAGGALALATALTLAGCDANSGASGTETAKKPEIEVGGAYIPEPTMDDMAAGFFRLTNKGGAADRLTSATSDIAGAVTLHSTKGGVMKEQKSFDVPADGELVLASGGNHLMLEELRRKPKRGEKVAMTLHFQKSDPITIEVPVKEATYRPEQHDSGSKTSHDTHMSHATHARHMSHTSSDAPRIPHTSPNAPRTAPASHASH
ncbi:copper chaperone PCu(A)C [Streptomyces sp. G44]|uniref:copper chaperone PCu(A)C n=1 Tax=Streptomyces sp. G44 TaxID=2807632 RepID=UPI001960C055|nr:copper chaperone PCu(A)C [Streptomyces sp. G44]MBM7167289.1 copper chaperone PCu(A)C [Streptomyces sp. G44]